MDQPYVSPDGNYEWDGQEWRPRQQVLEQPPQKPNRRRKPLMIIGIVVGVLVGLIVLGSVASALSPSTPTPSPTPQAAASAAPTYPTSVATPHATPPTSQPMPTAAPTPDNTLTMAKFNQIQNGMSYDQVKAIMGSDGSLQVDSSVAGITGQIYEWKGSGLFPAIVTVQFQNGAVIMKSQFGLD